MKKVISYSAYFLSCRKGNSVEFAIKVKDSVETIQFPPIESALWNLNLSMFVCAQHSDPATSSCSFLRPSGLRLLNGSLSYRPILPAHVKVSSVQPLRKSSEFALRPENLQCPAGQNGVPQVPNGRMTSKNVTRTVEFQKIKPNWIKFRKKNLIGLARKIEFYSNCI